QFEFVDVRHRKLMRRGQTHPTGFGVQTIGERFAIRLQAPADTLLRFKHRHFVSRAFQFVRGGQSRHARADDNNSLWARGWLQALLHDGQIIGHEKSSLFYFFLRDLVGLARARALTAMKSNIKRAHMTTVCFGAPSYSGFNSAMSNASTCGAR